MKAFIKEYIEEKYRVMNTLDNSEIENAIIQIKNQIINNKKIIVCGNGGSACTSSHFITDWNKMINLSKNIKFRGIALTDNIGLITAYSNDVSYDDIFSGQLKAILDDGDLVIGVSGSGNSKNVINALTYANANNANTLAVVGYDGGILKKIAKHCFHVKSYDMQICEELHLMFGHLVMKHFCEYKVIKNDPNSD